MPSPFFIPTLHRHCKPIRTNGLRAVFFLPDALSEKNITVSVNRQKKAPTSLSGPNMRAGKCPRVFYIVKLQRV